MSAKKRRSLSDATTEKNTPQSSQPLRVLFATSEIAPWVKTGGLGDVAAALPPALRAAGVDVRVLVPAYPALRHAFATAPVVAELAGLGGKLPDATLREACAADGTPLLLLDCPELYDRPGNPYLDGSGADWPDNALRFALLARCAALLGSPVSPLAWQPRIVHCNDWQTALTPCYLRYDPQPCAASLVTIHNLAFQGLFPHAWLADLALPAEAWSIEGVEYYGHLSFLKGGLQMADWITTVSPTYAREIQTTAEGMGLDGLLRWKSGSLSGILNGIDTVAWNPVNDALLTSHYDEENPVGKAGNKLELQRRCGLPTRTDVALLGVVSRMTEQKGLDLLAQLETQLAAMPVQLIVLGSGAHALERAFIAMASRHPDRIHVTVGFDEGLAHLIEAGADIFLMPSRFEPCGLNQMYSLRYGTPPVVRCTGGLADTVVDCSEATLVDGTANGFCFEAATADALLTAIRRAVATWQQPEVWKQLQRNGMMRDWGWQAPARQYLAIYRNIAVGGMPGSYNSASG